jgi:hypothetical protein
MKHFSLLGSFLGYEENEVLWTWYLKKKRHRNNVRIVEKIFYKWLKLCNVTINYKQPNKNVVMMLIKLHSNSKYHRRRIVRSIVNARLDLVINFFHCQQNEIRCNETEPLTRKVILVQCPIYCEVTIKRTIQSRCEKNDVEFLTFKKWKNGKNCLHIFSQNFLRTSYDVS